MLHLLHNKHKCTIHSDHSWCPVNHKMKVEYIKMYFYCMIDMTYLQDLLNLFFLYYFILSILLAALSYDYPLVIALNVHFSYVHNKTEKYCRQKCDK
jgi:hypothetical protein